MIDLSATYGILYGSCALGLAYAFLNFLLVRKIEVDTTGSDYHEMSSEGESVDPNAIKTMVEIGKKISNGANAFLYQEYRILFWFCIVLAIIIKFAVDNISGFGTFFAFLLGASTSVLSGFLGMRIAVFSNTRTAFKCIKSLADGFVVAFRAGCVMGFSLVCLSLAVMTTLIAIYRAIYSSDDYKSLYECIAGYGLGGSFIALFARVGGGIYTKAADVGADLCGKLELGMDEDDVRNPATIADNVGDNVGDIAGMGADLFGSFAESTCAALVVLSSNPITVTSGGYIALPLPNSAESWLYLPLLISAFGVFASFITSFFATNIMKVQENHQIERTLKFQLIISTGLLLGALYLASYLALDLGNLTIYINCLNPSNIECYELSAANSWICASSGLVAGLFIGLLTEYYTSNTYKPVQEVANACRTGAATNIIYGLALGYLSTVFPVILLALAAYISHKTLGMLGLAIAALGMLSNLAIGLAIDAYGPISDNAGGIAEMSKLGANIRKRTDALDAAGNTTAAIGKGFAIGSAALVSLSLYGAFITRASSIPPGGSSSSIIVQEDDVTVTDALVFSGLLVGAMLPYGFSAMTMKSVGKAANEMVQEIRQQFQDPEIRDGHADPHYERCIAISTKASLWEMIGPGLLVVVTPISVGLFLGPRAVAGLLPGALVSGVQMAISASNTGGAWDNAKKYIESGKLVVDGVERKKGTEEHKAAVVGDTVGDPLKDTSGPSLNILIKLMAILSLVFTPFFQKTGVLVSVLDEQNTQVNNN